MYILNTLMFLNVILMTDQVGQLIFVSFMQLVFTFALKPIVYDEELTLRLFSIKLAMTAATFVINSLISMTLLYISSMHSRMKSSNVENTKLLDAMHEGLLILSKADNESMFCNFPAQKLLKSALDLFEKKQKSDAKKLEESDKDRILKGKFFNAIEIAIKGQSKKFRRLLAGQNG